MVELRGIGSKIVGRVKEILHTPQGMRTSLKKKIEEIAKKQNWSSGLVEEANKKIDELTPQQLRALQKSDNWKNWTTYDDAEKALGLPHLKRVIMGPER